MLLLKINNLSTTQHLLSFGLICAETYHFADVSKMICHNLTYISAGPYSCAVRIISPFRQYGCSGWAPACFLNFKRLQKLQGLDNPVGME